MRKEEFLRLLREALLGDVPAGVIEENIRYYDSYITEEVRKGRAEEDVIAEIGDPRLIARTIEETTDGASDGGYEEVYSDGRASGSYESENESAGRRSSFHIYNLDKWYWKILIPIAVFAVLFLVISLVFTVISGVVSLVFPLLFPLLVIWLVLWIFRGPRRR